MKIFICDCVNPDLQELGLKDINEFMDFIDEADVIDEKEFLSSCEVEDYLKLSMKKFPNDFEFYRNGNIMFFTHSRIEHFYK